MIKVNLKILTNLKKIGDQISNIPSKYNLTPNPLLLQTLQNAKLNLFLPQILHPK
jgi:hypothetical protein